MSALILNQESRLASIGITIGLVAAFAMRGVVRQLLCGIQSSDPLKFTVVPVLRSWLRCWQASFLRFARRVSTRR